MMTENTVNKRRRILIGLVCFVAGFAVNQNLQAEKINSDVLRFPGDATEHNIVYQFNKADQKYHDAVLFSVSEMLRKYGDNITIVITAFGPGLHILANKPLRPVSEHIKQKIKSLAEYGIKFHACGNTMKTLGWTKKDMLPFVEVVKVGTADLMELQEKGFSYISW